MGKWTVSSKTIGERTRFGVYRIIDSEGNTEIRGGLWDTKAEAEKLARILNKDEEVFEDDYPDEF